MAEIKKNPNFNYSILFERQTVVNFGYFLLFAMLAWLIFASMATFAPSVEGRFFPVVDSIELTKIEEIEDGHSLVYGSARKTRECVYHKIEWFYGDPYGRSVLIPLKILEPSKIRPNGLFDFGPWKLSLDKNLVRNETFARVHHDCHPFWKTVTNFVPSDLR